MGLMIFIGTNWLLIKGGPISRSGEYVVGPHLQLLSQFFIGYRVSFLGSIIGFFYGFALGTLCGTAIGWIYNKIVDLRTGWAFMGSMGMLASENISEMNHDTMPIDYRRLRSRPSFALFLETTG